MCNLVPIKSLLPHSLDLYNHMHVLAKDYTFPENLSVDSYVCLKSAMAARRVPPPVVWSTVYTCCTCKCTKAFALAQSLRGFLDETQCSQCP